MKKTTKETNQKEYFDVVIIGRPNVGKSSLFNRLCGYRKAVVLDEPRTTRDTVEEIINKNGKNFRLIDTAGHFKGKGTDIEEKSLVKIRESLTKADLIVFVIDATVPATEEDKVVADIIRKTGKDVLLAANKVDQPNKTMFASEYERFGFKNVFYISTIHNLGISDLVSAITDKILVHGAAPISTEIPTTRLTIIGRPNVGKSSLLNALAQKDRAIVSETAGTTRDIVTEKIKTETRELLVSDTAGARRPGKIGKAYKKGEPIERYAYLRTEREIDSADIILLIIDASQERATTQDLHIAGIAKEKGKGIILVVNKWDLVSNLTQEKFLNRLRNRFSFMLWVPTIFISAKTGLNVENIPEIINTVAENQKRQIPTSKLNRIVEDFALENLPKGSGGKRPKIFFAAQTGTVPPTFTLTAKHHDLIHFSWRRALINELRRQFDFTGTPIKIIFKQK
jgi:GTP-binding protein